MPPAIYALADKLAPVLRAQFLAAMAAARDAIVLADLTTAIESGSLARVLQAVHAARLPATLAPAGAVVRQIVTDAAGQTMAQVIDAFHGTAVPFRVFDPAKIGSATDAGELGHGFYFSTDPNIAKTTAVRLDVQVRVTKPLTLEMESWGGSKRGLVTEALGLPATATPVEITAAARAAGYDGVVLDYGPLGYAHREILVFDAAQATITGAGKGVAVAVQLPGTTIAVRASFAIVNPLAAAAALKQAASLVTAVTTETQAAIRALVARAVTEGIAPRELATLIRPLVGLTARQTQAAMNARAEWQAAGLAGDALTRKVDAYGATLLKQRAVLIARTETIDAANAGQLAAWKGAAKAGLFNPAQTSRIWSAASDRRTCERCAALDEQTVDFDEPFDADGESVFAPPLHPNCRCSVSLVFDRARRAA